MISDQAYASGDVTPDRNRMVRSSVEDSQGDAVLLSSDAPPFRALFDPTGCWISQLHPRLPQYLPLPVDRVPHNILHQLGAIYFRQIQSAYASDLTGILPESPESTAVEPESPETTGIAPDSPLEPNSRPKSPESTGTVETLPVNISAEPPELDNFGFEAEADSDQCNDPLFPIKETSPSAKDPNPSKSPKEPSHTEESLPAIDDSNGYLRPITLDDIPAVYRPPPYVVEGSHPEMAEFPEKIDAHRKQEDGRQGEKKEFPGIDSQENRTGSGPKDEPPVIRPDAGQKPLSDLSDSTHPDEPLNTGRPENRSGTGGKDTPAISRKRPVGRPRKTPLGDSTPVARKKSSRRVTTYLSHRPRTLASID